MGVAHGRRRFRHREGTGAIPPDHAAAVLEKLGFGLAAVALFLQQRAAGPVLAVGCISLVWAALFAVVWKNAKSD